MGKKRFLPSGRKIAYRPVFQQAIPVALPPSYVVGEIVERRLANVRAAGLDVLFKRKKRRWPDAFLRSTSRIARLPCSSAKV
jgi:hypothetical protein